MQFLKDARDEAKRLLEASEKAKTTADIKLKEKVESLATQAPIQLKKD